MGDCAEITGCGGAGGAVAWYARFDSHGSRLPHPVASGEDCGVGGGVGSDSRFPESADSFTGPRPCPAERGRQP